MDIIPGRRTERHIYHRKGVGEELEVGDGLCDVGMHLVQLGVLGGNLPVLAPSHRVHDGLSEKREISGKRLGNCVSRLLTWMRAK